MAITVRLHNEWLTDTKPVSRENNAEMSSDSWLVDEGYVETGQLLRLIIYFALSVHLDGIGASTIHLFDCHPLTVNFIDIWLHFRVFLSRQSPST